MAAFENPLGQRARSDTTLRDDSDRELAAYADALAAEIAPTAGDYDRTGEFPHAHFAVLRERGALALTVPAEFGGQGRSLYQLLLFQERLGRASGPTALTAGWHWMVFAYLSYECQWPRARFERLCRDVVTRGDLINLLITEREAGNLLRGARPTTVAERTATGYRLNGRKAFCSGAPELRQMVVLAWDEAAQCSAEFVVPMNARIRASNDWDTLGMRATGSHDLIFDNVEIGLEDRVNSVGSDGSSSFTRGSRIFGLQFSAVYLGIALAARDFVLDFTRNRQASGLAGNLQEIPQVRQKIGEIELLLGAAKNLLYGLAERWERYPDIRDRLNSEVALVKSTVTQNAVRAVDVAMSIVGGHSLSRSLPLERYFRDVRCGLYNPPQDDMVIANLAKAAIAQSQAQAQAQVQ